MKLTQQPNTSSYREHSYEEACKHIEKIFPGNEIFLDTESVQGIEFSFIDSQISAAITFIKICIIERTGNKIFWPIQPFKQQRELKECFELIERFKP